MAVVGVEVTMGWQLATCRMRRQCLLVYTVCHANVVQSVTKKRMVSQE